MFNDLKNASLSELRSLLKQIDTQIEKRSKSGRAAALREVQAVLKTYGMKLEDVLGSTSRRASKIRFRDAENPELEWSGMGRRPKWFNPETAIKVE